MGKINVGAKTTDITTAIAPKQDSEKVELLNMQYLGYIKSL